MEGLNIIRDENAILKVVSNVGTFSLKAKDEKLEVIFIEAKAGKSLFLHPYECENAMYMFYLIEGKLFYTKEKTFLAAGDSITAKDLSETEFFDITEDCKILMITQREFFDVQAQYAMKLTCEMNKIQNKDLYTEEHCNRTGNLAGKIGTRIGLSNDRINELMFASKIHDLGKIEVPLDILNKPGKYTDEEFEIMKKHSLNGFNIISDYVTEREARIVLEHHEKINGSGYPFGINGDDMLLESRILAVADAYDALISDRPYRKGFTTEEAINIILKDKGILWDEMIVETLLEILGERID